MRHSNPIEIAPFSPKATYQAPLLQGTFEAEIPSLENDIFPGKLEGSFRLPKYLDNQLLCPMATCGIITSAEVNSNNAVGIFYSSTRVTNLILSAQKRRSLCFHTGIPRVLLLASATESNSIMAGVFSFPRRSSKEGVTAMKCHLCQREPANHQVGNQYFCRAHKSGILTCRVCKKEFASSIKNAIYCSPKCRFQPSISQDRIKKCLHCGGDFDTRERRKFCSSQCRLNYEDGRESAVTSRGRLIIFDRDGFRCIYCGFSSYGNGLTLHVDHIIPKVRGGSDRAENLVTACIDCNLEKSDRVLFSLDEIIREVERRNRLVGINPKQIIKVPSPADKEKAE